MANPKRGTTTSHLLEVQARRAFVFELRRTGASYGAIYQTMSQHAQWRTRLPRSYNPRRVHEDVMHEVGRLRTELVEVVDTVRVQEMDRLDRMLLGVWDRASHGDPHAIANVLAIMARRARYLPGLEGPVTIAPTNVDGTESYSQGPTEVGHEYVANVAGLLAQYGLYEAHSTNGDAAPPSNGAASP